MPRAAATRRPGPAAARTVEDERRVALLWIDSREAFIARLQAGRVALERLVSGVERRHRSTGHVRHDPHVRHGGGRASADSLDRRRREHLSRFLGTVARRLPRTSDLVVIGPGAVHEWLARDLRRLDAHHGLDRTIGSEMAGRESRRRLAARLRAAAGRAPRRLLVKPFRGTRSDRAVDRH